MRCVGKVTALHSFTQRVVFAHATYCVFEYNIKSRRTALYIYNKVVRLSESVYVDRLYLTAIFLPFMM